MTSPRALALCLALSSAACAQAVPGPDRGQLLLQMAADEAGQIASPKDRLERFLNLANHQNRRDRKDDARRTLASAHATLQAADASLTEHPRLAAFVSISQLARGADDAVLAKIACDQAVGFLKQLEPAHHRTDYVRDIAFEVRALYGTLAAVALLKESADWASAIGDVARKREALAAVAWQLFLCDDYAAGAQVLKREGDPAWRSDTLARLAVGHESSPPSGAVFNFEDLSFEGNYRKR